MNRARLILLLGALAAACDRAGAESAELEPGSNPAPEQATPPLAPSSAAPAPASSVAGATAVQIDRASVVAFVNRWAQLQNEGNFAGYSSLYAPELSAIERVGETATVFDRAGWLADRRRRFDSEARVLVSGIELLRSETTLAVVFEQQYSSASFSERGNKALTLQRAGEGWRIVREERLGSEVAPAGARAGACAALLKQLASAGAGVRYFANVASANASKARWASVSSHGDADGRSADGYAWEFWAFLTGERWQAASVSLSSPAGDSARASSFCFRPDGTLAHVVDRYRTLGEQGLVEDTVTSKYSREGAELSSKTDARYLATGKPAPTGSYLRPPPLLVKTATALPFAPLLK
jgi:hypothetical protein